MELIATMDIPTSELFGTYLRTSAVAVKSKLLDWADDAMNESNKEFGDPKLSDACLFKPFPR